MKQMRLVTSSTIDVARTIYQRHAKYYEISPWKLEKMMVIAYGEYLVKTGNRLFDATISVNKEGIYIKAIRKNFDKYVKEDFLVNTDKMYLSSEEIILRRIVEEYGKQGIRYINKDSRILALENIKKWNNRLTDEDILEVFTKVKKSKMDTKIFGGACEKAKWILNECFYAGYEINTYKLQKLLVLAYGECLVETGTKLFPEDIILNELGPFVKEVEICLLPYDIGGFYTPLFEWHIRLSSEDKLIKDIVNRYGNWSSNELSELRQLRNLKSHQNKVFVTDEDIRKAFA